jgi:hypothetical protein
MKLYSNVQNEYNYKKNQEMRRIPLALQTSYADLLDKCLDAEIVDNDFTELGNYVSKNIKDKKYWYYQNPSKGGKRTQQYVGPETPELIERINSLNSLKTADRERREIVRAMIRSRTGVGPPPQIGKTLQALSKAGVFRLRSVLVGTLAYQVYGPMLGVKLGAASLMTDDIDIAQFQSISIAVEDDIPSSMLDVLKHLDPAFSAISKPLHEREAISYKLGGLKVEFLSPMRGPDQDRPVKLDALNTSSQPLRFLDYLIYEEMKAVVLYGSGILVNVPDPTRYALHKLIVSQRRKDSNPVKANKDIAQADNLIQVLAEDRPHDLKDFWQELISRGDKWQELAMSAIQQLPETTQDKLDTALNRNRTY